MEYLFNAFGEFLFTEFLECTLGIIVYIKTIIFNKKFKKYCSGKDVVGMKNLLSEYNITDF